MTSPLNRNGAHARSTASKAICVLGSVTSQGVPCNRPKSIPSPPSSTVPYVPVYGTQVCWTNDPSR